MESKEGIRETVRQLLNDQRLAVVSTTSGGQPYANLVAFAAADDLRRLYFATPRSTRKFANLLADERMAVLISSSSNRAADFHEAMAVTAVGTGREISGEEKASALDRYLAKHPYLDAFAHAPTCALIGFTPRTYILVRNFQNVMELHLEP
jgi:nitroimidazol reductase NimA-like FMN-containing flavoprotein (pyridoxamine 5'-phosphate oxidase superfamily)